VDLRQLQAHELQRPKALRRLRHQPALTTGTAGAAMGDPGSGW
jgi:hypothetical protein